ncbi:MAG TPA: DUF4231 domain-containing protein [Solirubrobacterales bacterium]|nr:DUF4231 domain-containing protein [Solirubrobacterales bacterium]
MESALSESTTEPEVRESPAVHPAEARLEEQIRWYDGKSQADQRTYKALKICQLATAAAIPVAATGSISDWIVGAAGALIVVLEGVQQLMQYQQNWITYRATCERLKHEKFLHLAHAGPYATAADPDVLLAERVEGLVSQEHAAWAANREEIGKKAGGEG